MFKAKAQRRMRTFHVLVFLTPRHQRIILGGFLNQEREYYETTYFSYSPVNERADDPSRPSALRLDMIKYRELEALKESIVQKVLIGARNNPNNTPEILNVYYIAYRGAMAAITEELERLGHLQIDHLSEQ